MLPFPLRAPWLHAPRTLPDVAAVSLRPHQWQCASHTVITLTVFRPEFDAMVEDAGERLE